MKASTLTIEEPALTPQYPMPFTVQFDSKTAILSSAVQGTLTTAEVEAWRDALHAATSEMPAGMEFRFLSNLYDYEVAEQDLQVHKRMRDIGPLFLAAHAFPVGFWRLYEVTPPAPSRAGTCTKVAHLHRDCYKMDRYNELLQSPTEQFFCDPDDARSWLAHA